MVRHRLGPRRERRDVPSVPADKAAAGRAGHDKADGYGPPTPRQASRVVPARRRQTAAWNSEYWLRHRRENIALAARYEPLQWTSVRRGWQAVKATSLSGE